MSRRPWIAVAEKHAEQAVNLFVHVMQNRKLSMKLRMEAASRVVMIAGATFRGEKVDGNGRPAANLPGMQSGVRMDADTIRKALATLPPGSVIEAPEEAVEGDKYVVMYDSDHNRKPTGQMRQSPIGATVVGETPEEVAKENLETRLELEKEEELPPPKDSAEMIRRILKKAGTTKEPDVIPPTRFA